MSAVGLLDELLQAFTGPVDDTPAKAAIAANRKERRGPPADSEACEALRIGANPAPAAPADTRHSQAFADIRNGADGLESEQWRGISRDSQDSQGWARRDAFDERAAILEFEAGMQRADAEATAGELQADPDRYCWPHGIGWNGAEIARFTDRRDRLMRWGWTEADAEALADRLRRRDRVADPRTICAECTHYRPGQCANHHRAGLMSGEVGRDLAGLLQRCPGFEKRG